MAFGGTALKLFQTFLYAIEFCCAGIILGIYSYYLSVLADRNIGIPKWEQAVEGISGAACLYLIFAVLLTCFLGGKAFFAFLGIVLDLLFCCGFVALAVLTRDGSRKCTGNNVHSPLGNGAANSKDGFGSGGFGTNTGDGKHVTYASTLGFACRLNSAAFAVSIIGAILFLVSALVQLWLGKHHQKEKRYGPSPANGYTKGSGNKLWQRRRKNKAGLREAEMGTAGTVGTGGLAAGTHDTRPSHDTAYTGSTVAPTSATYENPHKPMHGGYHTAPTGTGVNPYGYDNTHTTHTTNTYTTPATNTYTTPATNY